MTPPRGSVARPQRVQTRPSRKGAGVPAADRTSWGVLAALVALSLIPVIAGSLRVAEIAGGPQVLPVNPRIDAVPAPVVVHIIAAAVFALVGSLQFSARLRRSRPTWHRRSGRVLVGAGMLVAVSGLWMTVFYPGAPGGDLLWAVRLVAGTSMAACIVLGVTAIRRHDIGAHRAWMIRAYALAVAAGTQTFTQGVGEALFGTGELSTAVSISSGWVINAAVAEWVIRRAGAGRRRISAARILAVSR
ncbi:DUF2306 domain-containing protein [Tessaracoccus sp. SD287]|uniref:DUF2306 domain-containing protein n=1 Tax=Tessaracoccus sp. SD287 TaxID=2782008 RepID=UPI001A979890|nr:DUF2306 domain-containing protein [Tessaracoccus sp. SD287]MBO1030098.1 DUF2306 domain-containing protein [Tessaracoccus sp. SD287]